ncbi:hypothetical protein JW964_01280 [candidate division KSB1 bacterium]|nr:hypothetical protein [candidate division KSB1 bacterium]
MFVPKFSQIPINVRSETGKMRIPASETGNNGITSQQEQNHQQAGERTDGTHADDSAPGNQNLRRWDKIAWTFCLKIIMVISTTTLSLTKNMFERFLMPL